MPKIVSHGNPAIIMAGWLGVFFSILVFVGYTFRLEFLYRPITDGAATHPLTAICFLLTGLRLALMRRISNPVAASLLALVIGVCLMRFFLAVRVYEWYALLTPFQHTVASDIAAGKPNNMGANTALMFAMIAISALFHLASRSHLSQITAFLSILVPTTSLLGYLYGLEEFYGEMSTMTVVAGLLLAVSTLFLTSHAWFLHELLNNTVAARTARWQSAGSVIVPILMGYTVIHANKADGQLDFLALQTIVFIGFSVLMIAASAKRNSAEESGLRFRLQQAKLQELKLRQEELSQLNSDLKNKNDALDHALLQARVNGAQFESLFTNSRIPELVVDREGIVTMANPIAEETLGFPAGSMQGMKIEEIVPAEHRDKHHLYRGRYNAQRHSAKMAMAPAREVFALSRSGKHIPVDINLVPIDTGEGKQTIAQFVDKTETVNQIQALERSNAELDSFAYIASHDLRAPLRTISSMSQLIAEKIDVHLDDTTRQCFDLLKSRVVRMDKLLTDLLEYSRLGSKESEPETIDTAEALKAVAELYLPDDGGFSLLFEGELPCLHIPRTQFDMVTRNILMNAVKHHDREAGEVRVRAEARDGGIALYFTDDGPGIPHEYQAQVFNMFTTLKPRDEVEGSGMGLSFIKKSMISLGGDIAIVPRDGRGATFELFYPEECAVGRRVAV